MTHYDYGFRIYNPALGKFLSVDPLRGEYPWYTPYQFAGNMPILCYDLDGEEGIAGAMWGMVGELAGQLITNGFDTEKLNYTQIAIAGVQGFISPTANVTRTAKIARVLTSHGLEYGKALAGEYQRAEGDWSKVSATNVFREGTQNIAGAIVGDQTLKKLDKLGGTNAVKQAKKMEKRAKSAAADGQPRIAQTNRARQAAKTLSNAEAFHKVNKYVNTENSSSVVNGVGETVENLIQSGTNEVLSINEPPEPVDPPLTPVEAARMEVLMHYSKTHGRVIEMRYDHSDGLYKHSTAEEAAKQKTDEKKP